MDLDMNEKLVVTSARSFLLVLLKTLLGRLPQFCPTKSSEKISCYYTVEVFLRFSKRSQPSPSNYVHNYTTVNDTPCPIDVSVLW